jgi:hypothetical protein
VQGLIDEYNKNHQSNVAAGYIMVLDESMSAWHPQTTKSGRFLHISFILHKSEPLGSEFKVMASPILDMGLALELQKGRDPMQNKNPQHLGSTATCSHHLVDMTKSLDLDGMRRDILFLVILGLVHMIVSSQ